MVNKSISIDADVNLIQSIRIIHALSESEFGVYLPFREQNKLSFLIDKFKLSFCTDKGEALKFSQFVKVDHFANNPNSRIGTLNRPLIFPHQIVNFCKSIWKDKRDHKYTFTGLLTSSRRNLLEQWTFNNIRNTKIILSADRSFIRKLKNNVFNMLRLNDTVKTKVDNLTIWSSTRGRQFPLKSWDENYYSILADSEFVLCPSGDYVWTYRFFETILCGAIPIVEEPCDAYDGFRFRLMSEDAKTFEWKADDAEYNYTLCVSRITIPLRELNNELNRLWGKMLEAQIK